MRIDPYLNKPGEQQTYSVHEAMELMKCAQDPVYFISNYIKVQHPKFGSVPLKLYDYQKEMVYAFRDNRFCITLSARQTGKSTTSVAFLLWYAMFHDDKTILIASNKKSNAIEMIDRMRYAYENCPKFLKPGVTEDGWNKLSIRFDNGSRVLSDATTENTGRGLSISLLFCDELAFVKKSIQNDFWGSITPTLSTGGSCIICSTPNGDDDKFAELWRTANLGGIGSDMDFKPIFVAWDQPPNRDEKFKLDMISKLGLHVWEQEFECKFISSDAMLMNSNYLAWLTEDLKNRTSISQSIGITQYKNYRPDMTYIIGVDPATGSGKDYSVIEVFEFPSMEQVAEFRSNTMSSPQLYTAFKEIVKGIVSCENTKAYFSIENNGVGEGMISLYMVDEKFPTEVSFVSEDGRARLGMTTNQRNKLKNCIKLKQLLENRKFKIRSQSLLKELKNFVAKGGSYEAQTGATDDAICATLIVVRVLDEISQYEDGVTSLLSNDIDVNNIGLNQIGDVIEPNWWGSDNDEVYSANEEPMGVVF